ncbi:MAG: ATP-binding protein [Frankiaceae bacterium]
MTIDSPLPPELEQALPEVLVTHAADAVVVTDRAGQVLVWNPAAERLLGYSAAEAIGRPAPCSSTTLHLLWQQAVSAPPVTGPATGLTAGLAPAPTTAPVELTLVHRDGRAVEVLADHRPVHAPNGSVGAVISVFRDITEQRVQGRALRTRTDLTERLHGIVVDLNSDLDLPSILRRISDSGVDLLGARAAGYAIVEGDEMVIAAVSGLPREVLGERFALSRTVLEQLIESGRPAMVGDIDSYPGAPPSIRHELPGLRTLAVARTVVNGEVTGGLCVFFDRPDRVVTQDELDALELLAGHAGAALTNAHAYGDAIRRREHERAVIDAMADGVAVIGADGAVRQWNPAAETMTGLAADQIIGAPLPFPLPFQGGQALDHKLPSGRWIEVLVTPIAGTDERVVDFRDITQPKNLEEAKDLFLATTSHELRTPITVMKGFAETLLHRWDDLRDTERQSAVQVIVQRTEALAALVEQLLLGTRAGAGAFPLSPVPLDVGSALRAAVAAFGHFPDRHSIELDVATGLPPILIDRIAFDNVIGQLLENAIKYSPDGGPVRVSATAAGEEVRISVEDEGVGIPSGHADRVFDRFYQADAGNRRRFGGVGLGLYIVRQLVEAQGGRVSVAPRDKGACLELHLPVAAGS